MLEQEDTIKHVRDFAIRAHGEQRYGAQPYVAHLDMVAFVLRQYGYADPHHLQSAYLHDVVEDARQEEGYGTWEQRIRHTFGETVHWVVMFCTTETGQNRKEKQAKNNAKYASWAQTYRTHAAGLTSLNAPTPQERLKQKRGYDLLAQWFKIATRVKLADRLANLRSSSQENAGLFAMYCKEAGAFREALFVQGICDPLWAEFDALIRPAQGQTAQGQTAQGQTAQGQTAQGQTAQGQTAQGQTAPQTPVQGQTAPQTPAQTPAQVARVVTNSIPVAPTRSLLPQANRKHADPEAGRPLQSFEELLQGVVEENHGWKQKQVAQGARKAGDPEGAVELEIDWSDDEDRACALPPTATLGQVREYLDQNCKTGVHCPACNRFAKEYKRKLNGQMTGWLIWLWKRWSVECRWYEAKESPTKFWMNREHARLIHWGLIEQAPNTDLTRRVSGLYRPTPRGQQFVLDEIAVPEFVLLHRNKVVGWAEKQIGVQAALGRHFSYIELMAGF